MKILIKMKLLLLLLLQVPLLANCQIESRFIADEEISGIRFYDSISVLTKCPMINKIWDGRHDSLSPMPMVKFYNKDSTELLTLILHPGSYRNNFAEFDVAKSQKSNIKHSIHYLPEKTFHSESGIKLGLTKADVIKLKGNSYKLIIENGNEILSYKVSINDGSYVILNKYSMPEYFARYIFNKNRLIEFKFGFTYP